LRLAGTLHAAADGLKTLWRKTSSRRGPKVSPQPAPFISFFPALAVFAVIPFGDTLCFGTNADGHIELAKLAAYVPEGGCVRPAPCRFRSPP
jgi:NADH-quinone oxidoreductase subunit H